MFVNSFSDPGGKIIRAPFGGDLTHWPLEILNIVALTESAGKTKMQMRVTPNNAKDEDRATFFALQKNVQGGFAATFDQLDEYLAKNSEYDHHGKE